MRSVPATLLVKVVLAVGLLQGMLPAVGRVRPMQALGLALVAATLSYVVADRLVLARAGNAAAVFADFALIVPTLWVMARFLPGTRLPFGGALAAGGALTVGEILYHQWLLRKGVGVP